MEEKFTKNEKVEKEKAELVMKHESPYSKEDWDEAMEQRIDWADGQRREKEKVPTEEKERQKKLSEQLSFDPIAEGQRKIFEKQKDFFVKSSREVIADDLARKQAEYKNLSDQQLKDEWERRSGNPSRGEMANKGEPRFDEIRKEIESQIDKGQSKEYQEKLEQLKREAKEAGEKRDKAKESFGLFGALMKKLGVKGEQGSIFREYTDAEKEYREKLEQLNNFAAGKGVDNQGTETREELKEKEPAKENSISTKADSLNGAGTGKSKEAGAEESEEAAPEKKEQKEKSDGIELAKKVFLSGDFFDSFEELSGYLSVMSDEEVQAIMEEPRALKHLPEAITKLNEFVQQEELPGDDEEIRLKQMENLILEISGVIQKIKKKSAPLSERSSQGVAKVVRSLRRAGGEVSKVERKLKKSKSEGLKELTTFLSFMRILAKEKETSLQTRGEQIYAKL